MPQYEVLAEVASAICRVVEDALRDDGLDDIQVSSEPPTRERLPEPPAVVVHVLSLSVSWLYQQRTPRKVVLHPAGEAKPHVAEQDAPALIDLRVALSAHAGRSLDALRLLGLAMRALFEHRVLRADALDAAVFALTDAIQIRPDFDVPWSDSLSYWRALGQPPAPVVFYRVRCRLESRRVLRLAPAPRERAVRSGPRKVTDSPRVSKGG